MKKKISPIKLHNLSEAEMATRELNLLRGGSGADDKCPCISICLPQNCTCNSGNVSSAIKVAEDYANDSTQSTITAMGNSVSSST